MTNEQIDRVLTAIGKMPAELMGERLWQYDREWREKLGITHNYVWVKLRYSGLGSLEAWEADDHWVALNWEGIREAISAWVESEAMVWLQNRAESRERAERTKRLEGEFAAMLGL